MLTLSIDTCSRYCSVCVSREATILAYKILPLERGHAEQLLPLIQETFTAAGLSLQETQAVCVHIGPGTFTGVRIGLAAARALGLALSCRVVGVTLFQLLAFHAGQNLPPLSQIVTLVPTVKEQFYYQEFLGDKATTSAEVLSRAAALALLREKNQPFINVIGLTERQLTELFAEEELHVKLLSYTEAEFTLLQAAWCHRYPEQWREPLPLYMREPDAKVSAHKSFLSRGS